MTAEVSTGASPSRDGVGLAARVVRKLAYLSSNYLFRLATWTKFYLSVSGSSGSDKALLLLSFVGSPFSSLFDLSHHRPPFLAADIRVRDAQGAVFGLRKGTDDPFHIMGWREPGILQHMIANLREGDVMVDAGANIGFYAITAAKLVGRSGEVHAIEMMPQTADILRSNAAASGLTNLVVHECALAENAGEVITASYDPTRLGQASINGTAGAARTHSVSVETRRLDDIIPAGPIRFLKIDLEGAELSALRGASKLLARVEALIFENTTHDVRIDQFLQDHGFEITHLENEDYLARNVKYAQTH